ncbi:non-ribosomal peptide synthetase [Kitasatospora sp. NBC_01266]|uniref:non-ribosomal peptide synthetase n=1 Tax=Kitasatospora sp. NBC_01266 TaxID=2903572 RepID=UPI002E337498|nr:non-ribosomal peptide synthetase [Kitasatospora sp. NBC_01266]
MISESWSNGSTGEFTPVHELVARQAALTPDRVAVVDGQVELSYAQLDARANRLAHFLRGEGVGQDRVVGICLRRSADLVVALLAVWRAGGAYLPLDPDQPFARLDWIVKDTGAALVLTEDAVAGVFAKAGVRAVAAGELAERVAGLPVEAPELAPHPADAAYVIYTSGSTGTPKGVVVSQAGIGNRIGWLLRGPGLGADDRVLQKTALTFDAHCWEVFAPLITGGAVVLAPAGAERDPGVLLDAVAEHGVTVLQVVPSVLRLLVEEPGWPACGSLRLLFSAGEALHAELVQRLLGLVDVEVWNTYGPTECSIDITAHRFDRAQSTGPVPIGRPLENLRVLVADGNGLPVPIGVAGELCAGGVGVARGYLGRPDLTADRFVPDAFAKDGSRLYRTGDRVRWRKDGVLEYLGRADDQAKVNGVRIEPGEVECALVAHPGVGGAIVTTFTAPDGGLRLVAYVQTRGGDILGELRGFLRERLPETHIPATFIEVEEFPLTSSGKVDRKALPVPGLDADGGRAAHRAPRTETERRIAEVWQELLKVERVGLENDFFHLGGTSLQLTRLANRLGRVFGREVKLRALLAASTVEAQARLIEPAGAEAEAATETATTGSTAIARVDRTGGLPLSFGQHRLWFMDRMNPRSAEWVAGMFLRVPADTRAAHVRRAVDALVARHEALRTRYAVVDGESLQFVQPAGAVELRELDVDRAELTELLKAEFAQGFDLENGPLLRALLARLPGEEQVLTLTMHHIVTDGWSSAIMERELKELLAAAIEEREPELPALEIQYADYAVWQREHFTEGLLEAELAHWRGALADLTPLALPTDRPRAAVRDGRGSVVFFTVPEQTVSRLTALGRAHGTTPFTTLLTGFAALLARQGNQWDVPIGTPVAGRDRAEIENVVGFFLNSLVLRCALDGELGFTQALERVKAVCQDAFGHQELPFERLVDELAPVRDLSRTPLYQVAFDLHDEEFNGATERAEDQDTLAALWGLAHTDLTLYLRRSSDGTMAGQLEYASALFDAATVQGLADRFVRLLTAVAADPQAALGGIDLLPAAERATLLEEFAIGRGEAVELTTLQRFERQAALTPERVAVAEPGRLTGYAELDARANRLAHHLRGLGVREESRVGVLLDRGADLLVALLAVWKAGAAYVPMDPSWPAGRVAGMATDAQAPVVLTQAGYGSRFEGRYPGAVVRVDALAERLELLPATAPGVPADLDRLAYLIYTSGSTGKPKGVAVPHRGLANHLQWAVAELASQGTGGGAVFSSVAFDLVVPNLWAPLLCGRRVTMLPQDLDLSELGSRLVEAGPFSFLKLTPGHLEILSRQVTEEQAAALAGVVVVAGEALPGRQAEQWAQWLGDGRLVNEYGPTEASVGTCTYPVSRGGTTGVVPIGRPLPNLTMYVLDQGLRPLPVGAVGELYVGGISVARGYADQPELTAERFLPDPFGAPGTRLYRTGDLARWLPEGAVEFLGRIDNQVKIRGYRIEPGEAQAVLLRHRKVAEAVVVALAGEGEGGATDARLAAYLVPEAGATVTAAELAAHCAEYLPGYLVPSSFTALEALPLNANGKVDRKALPAPREARQQERTAPRNVVEEQIAEIWLDLLGVSLGVHDNFFDSGGNSIMAIRLIAQIQAEYEISLPVRAIFEGPTIAEMAQAVEAAITAEIDQMTDSELMEEQSA